MKGKIVDYGDNNPLFEIDFDSTRYSFSVKDFPEDRHEWLVSVLSRQMTELYQRARDNRTTEIRKGFKQLLGL